MLTMIDTAPNAQPFRTYRASTIPGVAGLWDVAYYTNETIARSIPLSAGGYVLETTKGQIWRVTVPCVEFASAKP